MTTIKEDGINIIFTPFTNFLIPFNKIKEYHIRQYRPIIEYGGWGIRVKLKGIRYGKAYTVSGTTGLQINLYNGKEILIGTQKPEALIQTLNNIITIYWHLIFFDQSHRTNYLWFSFLVFLLDWETGIQI